MLPDPTNQLGETAALPADDVVVVTQVPPERVQQFCDAVSEHKSFMLTLAYRLTGSYVDAQDVVQESLSKAWRALPAYEEPAQPVAPSEVVGSWMARWLVKITYNAGIDQLRRQERSSRRLNSSVDVHQMDEEPGLHRRLNLESSAEAEAHLSEEMRWTSSILDALPAHHRKALYLYLEGYKYAEIAAILDVPLGTVRSRINRARATARQLVTSVT